MDSAYIALSTKPHYISSVRVMQITAVYNDSLVKRDIVVNSVLCFCMSDYNSWELFDRFATTFKGKKWEKLQPRAGTWREYLEYPGQHWVHNLVFNKFLKKCLGFLIDFISVPVIAGFTSAAAITIATGQVKALLGIKIGNCLLRGCQRCLK